MLALFAALIGPYFIDWTSYRTAFEREASRALGQPVQVRGDADARLVPFPSVTFSDVVIGVDEAGAPLMTVETFSMDAELAPFLRGEVRIIDMHLQQPSATLTIEADGSLNWALARQPVSPGETIVLEKVRVSDGDVQIVDAQNGRVHQIADIYAVLSAESLAGPWQIEGRGRVAGQRGGFTISTGTVDAENGLRLRARLHPDSRLYALETEGAARISEAKPRYDGTFTLRIPMPADIQTEGYDAATAAANPSGAEANGLAMVARGDFAADNERLRIEEYRLEMGGGLNPYVVTGEATVDTGPDPDFLLIAKGQQVNIDTIGQGAGRQAGTKTGRSAASGEKDKGQPDRPGVGARLAQLNRILGKMPPPLLPGRVEISLPALLTGETTVRDVEIAAHPEGQSWRIDRFVATLPGRTKVETSGTLSVGSEAGFVGDMVVASSQPSGLAKWLTGEVDPGIRRLDRAGFSAQVDLSAEVQRFEALELAIGPSQLTGRFERQKPEGWPANLSLDLAGDRFDIEAIRALAVLAGLGNAGEDGEWLGGGNLSANVQAGVLHVGGIDIGGFEGSAILRQGDLAIEKFAFNDLAGGSGELQGTIKTVLSDPKGQISGQIAAETGDQLLSLAARVGDGNTIIERLRTVPGVFDDLDLSVEIALQGSEGSRVEARGMAGGSTLVMEADAAPVSLDGMGVWGVRLEADNPSAAQLAQQAGFDVLPVLDVGPARVELSIETIDRTASSGGVADMAVSIKAGDSELTARGRGKLPAEGPLTGTFQSELRASGDVMALLFLDPALAGAGTLIDGFDARGRATVRLSDTEIGLDEILGTVDGNGVSGRLSFDRQSETLSARGALALERADLAWLAGLVLGAQTGEADEGLFSEQSFVDPAAGGAEFDVALRAVHFDIGAKIAAQNFDGQTSLRNGRLSLKGAEADWLGGRLAGDVELTNTQGTAFLSARLDLSDSDLRAVQEVLGREAIAEGRMALTGRFETSGTTPLALVETLTGGGEMRLSEVVLPGIAASALPDILAAADREGFEPTDEQVAGLAEREMAGGRLKAGEVVLPFTITNGVQRFSAAEIATQGAQVSVDGRVDLVSGEMTAQLQLGFEAESEAQAGAEPALAFALEGPIAAPDVDLDVSALTNFLSVRAFERERRRVELLQAGVLEKQRLRRVLSLVSENRAARAETEAQRRQEEARQREIDRQQREEAAARQAEQRAMREAEDEAARAARLEAARQAARQMEAERKKALEEAARQARAAAEKDAASASAPAARLVPGIEPPPPDPDPVLTLPRRTIKPDDPLSDFHFDTPSVERF
ncbi:AsmA family protein [Pseudohoeflea sp. DP4N28-3]|uniref:AsmA family protein n=1 Tax=Pseudohoeflea coraliihabitans TaxID=2860393 RepID=A0ABS6WIY0_9HYPH|nr:AsmA family protein [Pseudohoeflea sp. DP4N28-3]